ncbi:hypothetical protein [Brucella anthropi]|uniref:hypothetical protein n=1 Tax=Brucella anthropi TaxID=529 RepID=UPI0034E4B9E8
MPNILILASWATFAGGSFALLIWPEGVRRAPSFFGLPRFALIFAALVFAMSVPR